MFVCIIHTHTHTLALSPLALSFAPLMCVYVFSLSCVLSRTCSFLEHVLSRMNGVGSTLMLEADALRPL